MMPKEIKEVRLSYPNSDIHGRTPTEAVDALLGWLRILLIRTVNETNFGMLDSDKITITLTSSGDGEQTEVCRTVGNTCRLHHLAHQPEEPEDNEETE
ncbi:hypothetical protein HZC21_03055 [Candidatus Peregrinibacteria bacterium]|nr:hypothetical protein [Candidatus Peregrinibacteria bacterium]